MNEIKCPNNCHYILNNYSTNLNFKVLYMKLNFKPHQNLSTNYGINPKFLKTINHPFKQHI